MMKWFCRLCWRDGQLEFGPMNLADAIAAHAMSVSADINPQKTPNITKLPANHPIMQKFPGKYCAGDVHLGETQKRPRFKTNKDNMLQFDTGEASE